MMTVPHLPKQVVLRPKEERRIQAGHPWVFSNEIRETRGDPGAGDVVELLSAGGKTLGVGFYHPHSLITLRLLSGVIEEITPEFFLKRIEKARDLRARLYPGSTVYRLVHGESDFLPGLVIDRYGEIVAVQTFSLGMDTRLPQIIEALDSLFHPAAIVERNESPLRSLEDLPLHKRVIAGSPAPVDITENGVLFRVDVLNGQKTGFFLDQRENRSAAARYCRDATVIDCFCNDGGFGLHAAAGGARSVLGVDASPDAVARARANAALNHFAQVGFEEGDVFEVLRRLGEAGERCDVVILDPPSFTKNRKSVPAARKGYRELHQLALNLLRKGGILVTSSCSHHITPDTFLDTVAESARLAGRSLQLLDWRGAAPDHPVLPGVSETGYLKFGVFCAG